MGAAWNQPVQPKPPPPPEPVPSPKPKGVTEETLYKCVNDVLDAATKKRRKFLETVDLLVALKDYNFQKYKRVSGVVKLPHVLKPNIRACLIGYEAEREEAKANNLYFMDCDKAKKLNGRRKAIERLAARYDAFLVPEALVTDLKRILGPIFAKVRKCFTPLPPGVPVLDIVEELKSITRMWMRKEMTFTISVGHVKMSAQELAENVEATKTALLARIGNRWETINALNIKSTMGPAFKLC
ncbi:large ribosomal subunit protein uL1-like isoform X1 [Dermacentor andersoni]|uniref:large ribosomal subunit protein uL1-like isoform X1 n=1 Tax=Dermacentor andersoni TaxID=34620 RepID=UPI002415FCE9|nr:60S ribosomal protein L10a-2-like isoform X1 [Dermacentor andersoni]